MIFKTTKDLTKTCAKACYSFAILMLLGNLAANAQTQYTWSGGASGDWNIATNWTPNGIPGTNDEVTISNASVNTNGSRTVAKLTTTNANLDLDGVSNILAVNGGFTVSGGQFTNGKIVVNSTTTSTSISNNVAFYVEIEVTAPTISAGNSDFHEESKFTKTFAQSYSSGNTYHKDVTFIGKGGFQWYISLSSADSFKENIILGGANGTALYVGNTGFTTFLLPGKTVTIDPSNTGISVIYFRDFHQQGNTPQNIVGTGSLSFINSTWEAELYAKGYTISSSNSQYYANTTLDKIYAQSYSNGNTYHQNITFIGNGGFQWFISSNTADTFKENIILEGNTEFRIGSSSYSYYTFLANGKTITTSSNGASAAYFYNFHQQGKTSQNLSIGRVYFYHNIWEATFDVVASVVQTNNTNYYENVSFTAGGPTSISAGNTYQKQVSFINNGHYHWYMGGSTPDNYGGKIVARRTSNGRVYMAHGPGTHIFEHDLELQGLINFGESGGVSLITGNNPQTIQALTGYTAQAFFNKVTINKASNHVDLLTNLTVDEEMTFTKGLIKAAPNSTGLVTFNSNATYTGASTTSYVSGWVQKQGSADFIFPIGIDTQYRPLSMAGLSASAPVTAYFVNAPEPTGIGAPKCSTLSSCEHWVLNSANATVTFTLGVNIDNTCVDPFPANPSLFWFDKTQWNALNATISGNMLTATETATTVGNNAKSGDHYVTIGSKVSLPGGNVMTGPTTVCQNTTQTYSVPLASNAIYSWKLPIGWTIATTDPSLNTITVTVASNAAVGNQTITVVPTLKSDCDLCKLDPITLDVTVNALPNVGSIVGLTTANVGQSNITYSVTNTTGVNTFVWTLPTGVAENGSGSTGTITTTLPFITVDFAAGFTGGNINVNGTSTACGNGPTVSMFVSLCTTCRTSNTTLPDNLKNNHLTVYPNPIMGSETIKIQIEGQTEVSVVNVAIVDEKGATVKSFVKELQNGIVEIPGQSLAPGKYLLRIQMGGEIVGKKILKY